MSLETWTLEKQEEGILKRGMLGGGSFVCLL